MRTQLLVVLGSISLAPLPWTRAAEHERRARAPGAGFEELSMHFEVDLPPLGARAGPLPLPRSLLELPAELVLEASSGSGLTDLRILDATRRTVLRVDCVEKRSLGVTTVAFEVEAGTLGDALREYPPGEYVVAATRVDGTPIEGSVHLSGDFPGLFTAVSPRTGEVCDGDVTIEWTPSLGAARYVLEVEQDELGFTFETTLAAWQTSFTLPEEILLRGETYDYSLAVQGDTDNELEVEGGFVSGPRKPGAAGAR